MDCTSRKLLLAGLGILLSLNFVGVASAQDADGDGVIDPCDLCPATPAGMAVDEDGCRVRKTFLLSSDAPYWVIARGQFPDYSYHYHPEVAFDMDVRLDSPGGSVANASASISLGYDYYNPNPRSSAAFLRAYDDGHVEMWDNGDIDYWQGVHDALDANNPLDLCPHGGKGNIPVMSYDYDPCPHPTEPCSIIVDGCDDPDWNGHRLTVILAPDSDDDGVADIRDECPNTPAGLPVDPVGCHDVDGDGLFAFEDNCPDDYNPGQEDNIDGDGAGDECDICSRTDPKWNVSAEGCADRDEDGVSDYKDLCWQTDTRFPVNDHGCRIKRWFRIETTPPFDYIGNPAPWGHIGVHITDPMLIDYPLLGGYAASLTWSGLPTTRVWFRAYEDGHVELWDQDMVDTYDPCVPDSGFYDSNSLNPTELGSIVTVNRDPQAEDPCIIVTIYEVYDSDFDDVMDGDDPCPDTPFGSQPDPGNPGCPLPDADGDLVPDADDLCPADPCTWVDQDGCPDADRDGVVNDDDDCPDSPLGATVSIEGCTDADGDGVYVPYDLCPQTPGVAVDLDGCTDTDGDGLGDTDDACPGTPGSPAAGGCPDDDGDGVANDDDLCNDPCTWVDVNGCPDTDRDGVGDNVPDECPGTPDPCAVCSNGCPDADDDGDGVIDCLDLCDDPCTYVNEDGCPDMDLDGIPDPNDECDDTPPGRPIDDKGCHWQNVKITTDGPLWQLTRIWGKNLDNVGGDHNHEDWPFGGFVFDILAEEYGAAPAGGANHLGFGPGDGSTPLNAFFRLYLDGFCQVWDQHDVPYWQRQHNRPGGCPLSGSTAVIDAGSFDYTRLHWPNYFTVGVYTECRHPTTTTEIVSEEGAPPNHPDPIHIQVATTADSDKDGVPDSLDECPDTDANDLLAYLIDPVGCLVMPACDDPWRPAPSADVDVDCYVNEIDFVLMAEQWLTCVHPLDPDCIQFQPSPEEMYPDIMFMPHCWTKAVDGLLIDWPDPCWIALDQVYYSDANDILSAKYTVCWDPCDDLFYAAVQVVDTDHVFETAPTNWNTSDRVEIYVQADPNGGDNWGSIGNENYDKAQQYIIGYQGLLDWTWAVFGHGTYLPGDFEPFNAHFTDAGRISGDTITYEISAKAWQWYGGITPAVDPNVVRQLEPGIQVGFDVIADTRWGSEPHDDDEEFGVLSANLMTQKFIFANRFQRWELLDYDGVKVPPECGDWGYLTADVNPIPDCYVDMADFEQLSSQWMDCTDPCAPCGFIP